MTDFNYEQIIEYYDGTLDRNFTDARKWALNHYTTFEELVDRRDLPKRYFQIGKEPVQPVPPEPTEDDLKIAIRTERNTILKETDFTQLADAPFTEEEKASYREYRQYLRDFTEQDDWWHKTVKSYEEWSEE